MNPKLEEIDLSKTTKQGGAGIEVGPTYLVLYDGRFYVGQFSTVLFGLNFNMGWNLVQYDPPHENDSSFQKVWRFSNAEEISNEAEPAFMAQRREYAIAHKLESNGQTIDESAPLEAFAYNPQVPAMPKKKEVYIEEEE